MKSSYSIFLILFFTFSFAHLLSLAVGFENLGFYTKPFLISFLALWFYTSIHSHVLELPSRLFLVGLLFSVVGDILLMFVKSKGEFYFLLGLGSFLLAHLSYIAAFYHYHKFRSGLICQQKWLVLPFLIVLISILRFLWSGLGAYQIPVTIYSAIIITMAIFCLNMKNRVPTTSFQKLFGGAVLFVISDLIIAIEKFRYPEMSETWSGLAIMSTYLLGQFLLTFGMVNLRRLR